jgi:hypothetical protein
VTIALAVLLVFSGVGAAVSGAWKSRRLPAALGALAAVVESGLRVLRILQGAQRSLVTNGNPVPLPLDD